VPHLAAPVVVVIVGLTIVDTPDAAEEPETEPADTEILLEDNPPTEIVWPGTAVLLKVGTI